MTKEYKLTNWLKVGDTLFGNVSEHPEYADGSFIRTNILQDSEQEVKEGSLALTKSGSPYRLGKPAGTV